jgi:hypothetical protein
MCCFRERRRRGLGRTAVLLALAAGQVCAHPAGTLSTSVEASQAVASIFTPPPVQWDQSMVGFRPALQQTPNDFYNLTGGVTFGMSPGALNAQLPAPYPGLSWNAMALANEYPGEVRLLGTSAAGAGALRMAVKSCTGTASYVVFLFSTNGLFRLSYRLIADKGCPDTSQAAREIFARYVTIGQKVALSVRYKTGKSEVVDVTDPTAGYLIPIRWRQGGS